MRVTRREFLQTASAAAAWLASPHVLARALGSRTARAAGPTDPILVLVQLEGGNDGLNTVIPLNGSMRTDYDSLRPVIGIPTSEMAGLTEIGTDVNGTALALHPTMTALHGLYDEGKVAVINGVGYLDQNLSHFRSEDIWFRADPTGSPATGWIGTHLDLTSDPSGVAAASFDYRLTKVFDTTVAGALGVSRLSRFSLPDDDLYPDLPARRTAWNTIFPLGMQALSPPQSVLARTGNTVMTLVDQLEEVADVQWQSNLDAIAESFQLKRGLRDAASVIRHDALTHPSNDTGIRFFHVRLGGFDTHSNQEETVDRLQNRHGRLLSRASETITAFVRDMEDMGPSVADRTLIMTFSEFGRRAVENSTGTDAGTEHGAAAPLFLIGTGLDPTGPRLHGPVPDLQDLDDNGNQKFHTDFREVYATVLERWLGQDPNAVIPGATPGQWNALPGVLP